MFKWLLFFSLITPFAASETYRILPFSIISYEAPPANLLSLFYNSNKNLSAIKNRYDHLAKTLKLRNVFSEIHSETFFEAYMAGLIDRERILELTQEALFHIREGLKKAQGNARFSVTFFHSHRVSRDFHEQASFIARKNNRRYNYNSFNQYVIKNNLLEKHFSGFGFIDKRWHGLAFTYLTYSIKLSMPKKYRDIIGIKKNKQQKLNFDELLRGYSFCEKYWYNSVIRIFQNEKLFLDGKEKKSSYDFVNSLWNHVLSKSPIIEQISASAVFSTAVYPFQSNFYNSLITPTDAHANKLWKKMYLSRKQFIFRESLKTHDSPPGKDQYSNLLATSEDTHFNFEKWKSTILYGFGLPPFALFIDSLLSLNKLAFIKTLDNRFGHGPGGVESYQDDFWKSGLALYFTLGTINKLQNLHPFIEYWFLMRVFHANNVEKFIFAKNIAAALGNNFLFHLKSTPTIKSLFDNNELAGAIFTFHKIIHPVYTLPGFTQFSWPEINVLKKGKQLNLVVENLKKDLPDASSRPESK